MLTKNLILKLLTIIIFLVFIGSMTVCRSYTIDVIAPQKSADLKTLKLSNEPISPIPTEIKLNSRKVELGEKLFNDTKLSHDNTISCASCHSLDLGGTDRLAHSIGIKGQVGAINTPTVFNSAYNFKQFWDGRAETLEAQIDGPPNAATEMGSNWEEIKGKLNASPEYVSDFENLYSDGIQIQNIKDTIAVFERSLITPNARFDRYLNGEQDILTKEEKEGYQTFKAVGCASCHQGINIGGNLFQEFGVMGDYFKDRGNITDADLGRYNVTKNEFDRHVFKVPSLRNIEKTYPYFHDGTVIQLEEAVEVMSKYQLGRKLSRQEIDSIVKFLKTLNGEYKRY